MAFWFITFAPICLTDASLSQITGSWIWTDSFYFIDQSMLSNSSKVITNKNKIQTINWDCYLIYGLFGLWWCNCISTFQLYYCSSYTCGLHTAQRYPIIGLTMSSGPILLLPLAPCLLLSVLEVFWGHFGFKKKKKGLPSSSWSLPLLRWLRLRGHTSKSSTNPDRSLCLTESLHNLPEQIVYKSGGNGRERKTYLSRIVYFIQMLP